MTPRALLRQTVNAFREAGVPDPEVDAALLLSSLTGQPPLFLRTDDWTALPDDVLSAFDALAKRRLTREPLQYILHSQSFLGRDFFVDERVLIPRPETELLAERAMEIAHELDHPLLLDLCCGSGCIAVSLALALPNAEIHACDLSEAALAVARKNAAIHHARLTLHQGNLFDAVTGMSFDLIVANPPYIPTRDCEALQTEVLHEPRLALDGGADGLDFYRRIAAEAPLNANGTLLVEVGDTQSERVAELFVQVGFRDVRSHQDYQQIQRMVEAHR